MEFINNKGNIAWFIGGLGNQMFIIASAYSSSRENNYPLYFFKHSGNEHNINNFNYSETIFRYFGKYICMEQSDELKEMIRSNGYKVYENLNPYDKYSIKNEPILFNNHFQYYPTLKPYENDIRHLFNLGLELYRNNIKKEYTEYLLENSAFLHIRRGDYLQKEKYHPNIGLEYYEKAIGLLIDKVRYIYVLSDDIEWVKKQQLFKNRKIILIDSMDELYCLAFMSLCLGGAICANSTFSWWGAFLGAYGKRNNVFVPRVWSKVYKTDGLYPDEWIKLY